MAFLPTFFRKSYPPDDDYWYRPVGAPTTAGVKVDEKTALKYLTVMSCVSLIASDIAKLPLNLYKKRADGGKDLVTDNNIYDLLHNAPNQDTTSFNWRETLQSHLLLWGNSYAYIERDQTNRIIALWQLPDPSQVQVKRVGGQIVYIYKNGDGKEVTRTKNEIFHIPGYGFNGLYGLSMIQIASEAIGLGVAATDYGAYFFSQGLSPSGSFETDQNLGDNRKDYIDSVNKQYGGLGNSHKAMVLEKGIKYKPISIPMDDAQFLNTRSFQKLEICGMYHVPPHKIAIHGANSNNNNLEQENGSYVDSCLMAWIVRWESNISLQLLTPEQRKQGFYFKFVLQALLRGDSKARSEFYSKVAPVGGITPNEIRALEEMNPIEGGDEAFIMMNMMPLSQAKDMPLPGDEPATTTEPDPEPETKSAFKEFFSEKRAKKISEAKSIQLRDRIAKRYAPLILDAATAIVNRESKAIKNQVVKSTRANGSMSRFLDDFYDKFPEYIDLKMGPVLRSYIEAVMDATNDQLGIDGENLDSEIRDYVDTYAFRHVESSKGQMDSLLPDGLEAIDTRADEWQERRPEKISDDESVRASSFAFQAVVFAAGLSTVWRIRGKTCPYCTSLSGKRVSKGQSFVNPGDEIDPEGGTGPMRFSGIKQHPTLHQK